MNIDAVTGLLSVNLYKTDLFSLSRDREKKFSADSAAQNASAKIADPTNLTTGFALGADTTANSLWQTQSFAQSDDVNAIDVETADTPSSSPTEKSAAEKFLDFMNKTPEQLMREAILKELGYTEEQLAAMDPKERAAIEAKIQETIKLKVQETVRKEMTGEDEAAVI